MSHRHITNDQDARAVTADEIQQVLMSEGYSGDLRMSYLKEVLTALVNDESPDPSGTRSRLVGEIKDVLAREQSREGARPIADGTL